MSHRRALENARQRLDQLIATSAATPSMYVQRGMVAFKLADIAAAIKDFDQAERLDATLTPYLWQRGLAYYYAGRFAEGARQFEIDLTVNRHDVEETVWRYLCQARLHGPAFAGTHLYPVRHDARPVMAWIYQLFAGECTAEAVLAHYHNATRQGRFYSHLYVGLYWEAEGDGDRARHHISEAAALQVVDDYMGWVAIVHQQLREWSAG